MLRNHQYTSTLEGQCAFGMSIKNRNYVDFQNFRYSFNGKESDPETETQDYGMRIYNPALGRFLSVDPLSNEYPWNSNYAFAENDVIRCIDLDGLEKLTKTVTSDPNTETGEPGKAKIVISKSYQVVTTGIANVPESQKINPSEFSKNYERGNVTLFMTTLPTDDKEAVFLEGKNARLAKKALNGDIKAAKKLQDAGVNYYITEVVYDYKVTVVPDKTLNDLATWASEDPAERGIIGMGVDPKDFANFSIKLESELEYIGFNTYNMRGKFTDPKTGAAGSTLDYTKNDIIIINPKKWKANVYSQPITDVITSNSRTEDLIHEAGHNSTDLGHQYGYDYSDEGLSSNQSGKVYPTIENTKIIINNAKNRATIKE